MKGNGLLVQRVSKKETQSKGEMPCGCFEGRELQENRAEEHHVAAKRSLAHQIRQRSSNPQMSIRGEGGSLCPTGGGGGYRDHGREKGGAELTGKARKEENREGSGKSPHLGGK